MQHWICKASQDLYPKTLLDTKYGIGILALLEVTRLCLFEKVLGEFVGQLDKL